MQRGGDAPIFASGTARYPVLLFSHGLSGSPIDGDYIQAVTFFASHGYVVVAPFHGDLRFADINLDNISDALYALLHFQTFVAMQAVRPLSLSSLLTAVLNHPDFRDHVDAGRIGGFGASLGGESLLLMAGAALTTSLTSQYSARDLRRAAAGGGRLRSLLRRRAVPGLRPRPGRARRGDAAVPRAERHGRHHRARSR